MKSKISKTVDPNDRMNAGIDNVDALRGPELAYATNLLQVKNNMLVKERARLLAKYGATYPGLADIDIRLDHDAAAFPAAKAATDQANTKTDPFNLTDWRIIGYVADSKGNAVNSMTVLFADQKGQALPNLPYGCTDVTGYYAINLNKDQVAELKDTDLFLAVICKQKRIQVVKKDPLRANAGRIEYQDIVLNENECEPPVTNPGNPGSPG